MMTDDPFDADPTDVDRRALVVRGRVQGVNFRWWTRETATRLGLRGTVRNRADGAVEVHVGGSAAALSEFLDLLRTGPSHARVDSVEEVPCSDLPSDGFRILF